ncbi:hypothetical protein BCR32DRAFT_283408 [Anaeromyces robustus]|uniref:Uncharacterized protein n=1 Tax=Anaeromyces robustus TaxID=1754192 RepID=A0A1Y1WUH5_9FUNG|nr:hypothetical protein BCR32DRAFT_283408 [Anaeromyces robustus]|eukprot:ORX77200.1 hypothetical protein BCR32DRAFT_283408 [Anaeromyces robustus]
MSDTKAITFNRLPILGKPRVEFEDWKFSYERWCSSNKVTEDEKLECLISITDCNNANDLVKFTHNDWLISWFVKKKSGRVMDQNITNK